MTQQAASGWPGVTLGLRASESDSFAWKKFNAAATQMVIEYNSTPNAPTAMFVSEKKQCLTGASRPVIGTTTPTMYATMRDVDTGQNLRARFQWFVPQGTTPKGEFLTALQNPVGSYFQATVPTAMFADGGDISWRVRAEDGTDVGPWGAWCEYHIDATHPAHSPTVTSTDFPTGSATGKGVGRSGVFSLGPNGVTDVVKYAYAFNAATLDPTRTVPATGAALVGTLPYTPTTAVDNFVTVWALDAANSPGPATQYAFLVDAATPVSGQWLFDDASGGTTADSSTSGAHPLTLPAAGMSWAAGRDRGGVAFTSAATAATSSGPVVGSGAPVTVSAWVALSTVSVPSTVVGLGGTRTTALSIQYSASTHAWCCARAARTLTPRLWSPPAAARRRRSGCGPT